MEEKTSEPATSVPLGPGGLSISPLGIGTWAWGERFFWGYGTHYTEADLRSAFQASLEAGINFFDTAEVYGQGRSEQLLGSFVRASGSSVVVATKFFPFPWRLTRQAVVKALRASLNRLGLPKVDLYQIHWPMPLVKVETYMAGLADAVEAGLVHSVGVSNYGKALMQRAHAGLAERGIPLASNQVEYSLLQRGPERTGLLEECRRLGVTLIAYSPLAQGLLSGKYTPQNPPPGLRGRRYSTALLSRIQPLIGLLREIGEAHGGKTPAQVALNWVICKGAVPIPGAKNIHQARENAGALNWFLTKEEVVALDSASQDF